MQIEWHFFCYFRHFAFKFKYSTVENVYIKSCPLNVIVIQMAEITFYIARYTLSVPLVILTLLNLLNYAIFAKAINHFCCFAPHEHLQNYFLLSLRMVHHFPISRALHFNIYINIQFH